jgi:hypothetical protein
MKPEELKKLIELAISAHKEVYNCEGVCFLNQEEEKELNELIAKYENNQPVL